MSEHTYVLTLREVPKSANKGGGGTRANHYAAAAEKKSWEGKFLAELMAERVRKGMEFCAIDVTIRWKYRNRRDEENYRQPVLKPLQDALVKGGYLGDDTREWCEVRSFGFEYPEEWPHADPRLKGELVIRLEASYLN